MSDEKSFLTRIGEVVDAAKDKAQELGAAIAEKASTAMADTKDVADKAATAVARKAKATKATVVRRAKVVEKDAKTMLGKAERKVKSTAKSAAKSAAKAAGKVKKAVGVKPAPKKKAAKKSAAKKSA